MKKMINMLLNKKGLIISFIVGVIVTSCISYGVNSITSEGVKYTKSDGTTVSVKQALDDVINKSLSEINTLKSDKSKLEDALKNLYPSGRYLADVASVGDYVAYDAGTWISSAEKATSQGQFGGYTKGENKGKTIAGGNNGWRVLSIDRSTKTVTLVHAGSPEYYYHEIGKITESINNLNNRGTLYLNESYASTARSMTLSDLNRSEVIAINTIYYLASDYGAGGNLYVVSGGWKYYFHWD